MKLIYFAAFFLLLVLIFHTAAKGIAVLIINAVYPGAIHD
jgi:hypothetical protein